MCYKKLIGTEQPYDPPLTEDRVKEASEVRMRFKDKMREPVCSVGLILGPAHDDCSLFTTVCRFNFRLNDMRQHKFRNSQAEMVYICKLSLLNYNII